jgi:sugar lactone lactonase YvrE
MFSEGKVALRAQGGAAITTIAGGGVGDGWRATEALLNHPEDVVVDRDGNIYVAEDFYERVRRIDAMTGVITTVAGNGATTAGALGDNGSAKNASLNAPQALAIDGAGTIFIADTNNHRVRRVDGRTGIITTVAGDGYKDKNGDGRFSGDNGSATKASLNRPRGLALDSMNNLYISDWGNNRIRKVDANGIITTFAGKGGGTASGDGHLATDANLNPAGLAFDALDNLYIADYSNHLIRKIDRATKMISTVAGDGFQIALDIHNPCTLGVVGDGRLNVESGQATRVSLNFPQDVVVDAQNNVYIADSANQRIRRLSPDGTLTTLAGSGSWDLYNGVTGGFGGDGGLATMAQFNTPSGVAIDLTGNMIIADSKNDRLRMIDGAGVITTIAGGVISLGDGGRATDAAIYTPQAVATDAAGNVFIAEPATSLVRRVDAQTGIITTYAGNGKIGYSGDGGPATAASLGGPIGLVVDSKGNLYISELFGMRVRKVDKATGIITTYAGNGTVGFSGDNGPATQASLNIPRGLAVDTSDNLYIADSCNQRIRRVDAQTEIITTVAGNGDSSPPSSCNPNDPCRGNFDADGRLAIESALWSPLDVAVDAKGDIIIADTLNFRVRFVDAQTKKIRTLAGDGTFGDKGDNGPATQARFRIAYAVAVDKAGNILVADFNRSSNRIRRIDMSKSNPTISTVAGNGALGFSGDGGPATDATMRGPSDIAAMPDGNFIFTDTFNHRVRRVK